MMAEFMDFDEFTARFSTEEACEEALFAVRWPNGFRCPRCNCSRAYPIRSRKLYQCADCHYQASLIAGTVFEHSRTPLSKWFIAIYMMSRATGISAVALQKILKVTYKTAWTMLMKLRCAMGRKEDADILRGMVKLNPVVYGAKIKSALNYCDPGEHPVMLCAETSEEGVPEKIKIKCVPDDYLDRYRYVLRNQAYRYFQSRYVEPESSVEVFSMSRRRYFMELSVIVKQAEKWVYSTFIAIGRKHLQKYLDEYCFRFNTEVEYRTIMCQKYNFMRSYRSRFASDRAFAWWSSHATPWPADVASFRLFESILTVAVSVPAMTYRTIVQNPREVGLKLHRFPAA